eukprot:261756-Rhodomonas_salina.5
MNNMLVSNAKQIWKKRPTDVTWGVAVPKRAASPRKRNISPGCSARSGRVESSFVLVASWRASASSFHQFNTRWSSKSPARLCTNTAFSQKKHPTKEMQSLCGIVRESNVVSALGGGCCYLAVRPRQGPFSLPRPCPAPVPRSLI